MSPFVTEMDGEQATFIETFSGISAQDNILAVQEARAWIEVSLLYVCKYKRLRNVYAVSGWLASANNSRYTNYTT